MTAFILKLIACISMLIDHVGAVLRGAGVIHYYSKLSLYYAMRAAGRIAFPIYAFLLVDGAFHTRSRPKYLLRLLIFALISEIPFDIAFNRHVLEFESQNVFFTLVLGLAAIIPVFCAAESTGKKRFAFIIVSIVSTAVCSFAAWFLKTDYDFAGVLMIVFVTVMTLPVKYLEVSEAMRRTINSVAFLISVVAMCLMLDSRIEFFALAGVILIAAYNGKKGYSDKYLKYAFYAYYPLHLLLLGLIFNLKSLS